MSATRRVRIPEPRLPSVEALVSPDDGLLAKELWLLSTRRQIAVVRAIADALEQLLAPVSSGSGGPSSSVRTMHAQLLDEVARLGAQALRAARPANDDSQASPPA